MTGFYNRTFNVEYQRLTIALPEMTGFYNLKKIKVSVISTIALPETAGLWYIRTQKGPQGICRSGSTIKKRP